MFQLARLNTVRLVAFQARSFTAAPALAAKTAGTTAKSKKAADRLLKKAEKELQKEKAVLTKLQDKLKKLKVSEKGKKEKEAEKKREEKAFKPYKKLSGLNLFISENHKKFGSFEKASRQWPQLTASEKEPYAQKAEKLNEENLKIYTPKPSPPTPAYAKFTKSVWVPGEDFAESSKNASEQWRKLTAEEKASYSASVEEWEAYRKVLKEWKEERLKLFETKN